MYYRREKMIQARLCVGFVEGGGQVEVAIRIARECHLSCAVVFGKRLVLQRARVCLLVCAMHRLGWGRASLGVQTKEH